MNDLTKLRIRVAELCGWTDIQQSSLNRNTFVGRKPGAFDIEGRTWLPDYCTDLNACQEFERFMDERQQDVFAVQLGRLTGGAQIDFGATRINATTKILFATAEQRCRAFVTTMENSK